MKIGHLKLFQQHTVGTYRYLPYNVGKERQRLDLGSHEVHKDLLVEGGALAQVLRRLQADGVHDERDEFRHFRMHKILKCSVVNNSAVCGFPGCFVIILSAFFYH